MLRLAITLVVLLPTLISAQDAVSAAKAPALHNSGEPLRVPFTCAEEELQSVGLLCTEDEPCAIYLELANLAIAGKKIFLAGNLHSTSATLSSILLSSDDSGATWKEPAPRVRGAALEQLEFYDLDHGWAAGETQYPLPRDPFFLLSTDGGATWRQRLVTEEGGPGSLQRFWFDSAQHGELIVDAGRRAPSGRYLAYESETGGESWMIRSTTADAPKIKRAPPVFDNPDFRLRAAAGGKAYIVEKRVSDKWDTVASFLIEIASCRIKPQEAQEPPPEPPVADPPEDKDYVEELHLGADPPKGAVRQVTPGKSGQSKAPQPKAPLEKGSPD